MRRSFFLHIFFLTFTMLGFQHLIFAQVPVVRSVNKVVIEGKVYYVHQVAPGQTLYSISKAYEISGDEIIRENPGADKVLSVGQVLKIPVVSAATVKTYTEPEKGKKEEYRKHTIQEGETFYSISKKYNVSVEEIEKVNPSLVITDIPVGQVINIPLEIQPEVQVDFIYHRVRRKETIYGISKKYGITIDELIRYNPELKESMPRTGQYLRIPSVKTEKIAPPEEEMVAVYDSLAVTPVDEDSLNKILFYDYYLDSLPPISGRSLNVAYLIPFNYSAESIYAANEDKELNEMVKSPLQNLVDNQDIMPESRDFLEFMSGTLLVIDKLRKRGVSVNIFFYDTRRNTTRVKEILDSNQFSKMDLIIGPFFSFNVEIVSEYSRQHRIPLISPFYDDIGLASRNPYMFQVCPSYSTEYDLLANYLAINGKGKNIILIQQRDSIRDTKKEYLSLKIKEEINFSGSVDSTDFKEIIFDNLNRSNFTAELTASLSKTKENLIIINENNEVVVKPIVTQLFYLPKTYSVKLFGLMNWMTFQSVDYLYFHKLGLTYFTPYYFNYESKIMKDFLQKYTEEFYSEPEGYTRKGCPYAIMGHDISNFFLQLISKYGRRFITHLDEPVDGQLLAGYRFERIDNVGGYENKSLMMVTLLPDLNISARKYDYVPQAGGGWNNDIAPRVPAPEFRPSIFFRR